MNRNKVYGLILAAFVLAAVVPATSVSAQVPVSFRLLWGLTAVDFQDFTTADFGAWYLPLPNVAAYNNLQQTGKPIPLFTNGASSTTKLFNGTRVVGSVTLPNGTIVNLTAGNIIVVHDEKDLKNFTVYVPIQGDPTIIEKIDASVFIVGVPGVGYSVKSGYQQYTDGSAMAAARVLLDSAVPLKNIKYIIVIMKVAYIDGSGTTRFIMNPIVIMPDHKDPGVNIETFEYNQSDTPLAAPGWHVVDVSTTDRVAYFNDSSTLSMNVSVSDDRGIHEVIVQIYNCSSGDLLGETRVYLNHTRYVLNIVDTPHWNNVGVGVPPTYVGDDIILEEQMLYDSKYLLSPIFEDNTGAIVLEQLNTSDIITEIVKSWVRIEPVLVQGTDQNFIIRFNITDPSIKDLFNTQNYKIVVTAVDTIGKETQDMLVIGDEQAPEIIIGAPTPGSIYNAQGWQGIKIYAKISDPETNPCGAADKDSSNITRITVKMTDQFGNVVDMSNFAINGYFPPEFNWVWTGTEYVGTVKFRDLAPQQVPTPGSPYPFYIALDYLTHNLPDGKYTVTITAEDRVGHVTELSTWFIVDTIAPRITSVTINGNTYDTSITGSKDIATSIVGGYVDLAWNATDKVMGYEDTVTSGIIAYHVSVTDATTGNTVGVYTLSEPYLHLNLNPGTYNIEIYAEDAARNPVDPSFMVQITLEVQEGHGLASFVGLAKELDGKFVVSQRAVADNYATLMFTAPTTGPLPVKYADEFDVSGLTSNDYVILVGGPAVNDITAYYQDFAPVKMLVENGVVNIVTPTDTFEWTAPDTVWYDVHEGYFVIQMLTDSETGATIFMIYGTDRDSTAAGAYWLYTQFATGAIQQYSNSLWVVGKWTDSDGKIDFDFLKGADDDVNGFSAGDSITIVAQG